MSGVQSIIYDVDGTLVDSEPLHVKAWQESLKNYSYALEDVPQSFLATMAGRKPIAIAETMVQELGLPLSAEDLLQEKTKLFWELASTHMQPMPGAIESVRFFKQNGYRLAIGTSLDRSHLDMLLSKFAIQDDFEVIVTGDQIKNGKPHPETYLKVAESLNVSPETCLVFEDAQTGVQSAKAAGMYCIAIQNANAAPQDLTAADKIVTNFYDAMIDYQLLS